MNRRKPPDKDASNEVPSGGRQGPRGGRWASQERWAARAGRVDDDPGPAWENCVRAMEDAISDAP